MTDPVFPFEADVDPAAERAARGPLDRRDLVVTLLVAVVGALVTGAAGLAAVLELAVNPDALLAVVLTGIGPFACWVGGATLALVRLIRRRRRAWLPMAIGAGLGVAVAVVGVVVWLGVTGLLSTS